MKFKKDDEGKLVLDDKGDPIAITEEGEVIPLDKVVSVGKYQRVETERDELKTENAKLTTQIGELTKLSGDKEALEKRITEITEGSEKTRTELEERLNARTREFALDTTLLGAGVPLERLRAAKAYVDVEKLELDGEKLKGFDAESFKKDHGYLFETVETGSTGGPSRGGADAESEKLAAAREAAGLPPKKE